MNKHRNLSSSDWLLLSAYLDDQLSDVEKRQMDERLQSDPECRKALDSLRRTSSLLRSLPVRRAPRNFTLSAKTLPRKLIPSFVSILRFSSAAAALLLVAAFALDLTQRTPLMSVQQSCQKILSQLLPWNLPKCLLLKYPEGEAPMIIFWGDTCKGGGRIRSQAVAAAALKVLDGRRGPRRVLMAIGGGGPAEEALPETAPMVEELPAAQPTPYAEMPAPEVIEEQQPETEMQPQTAIEPEPLTGSGPILGVRPSEEKAAADEVIETPLRQPPAQSVIPFRLIEIVLAALLILTAIPAWLLKRK